MPRGGAARVTHKRPLGGFLMTRPRVHVDNHVINGAATKRRTMITPESGSKERRSLTEKSHYAKFRQGVLGE